MVTSQLQKYSSGKISLTGHSYVHTIATSAQFSDNTTGTRRHKAKQKTYSERLADRNRTKRALVRLLDESGDFEQADKVKSCGAKFSVVTCGEHILSRQAHFRCSFRFCPFCAGRRSQKFVDKYFPLTSLFIRRYSEFTGQTGRVTPCHLTLTQAHRIGETYKETRKRLLENFKKLNRNKFWNEHFAGALVAVESTLSNDGSHHAHLHLIAFRRSFFDVTLLRDEYLKITGDSHVLRLDEITDLQAGLKEVIKYSVKPQDIEKFSVEDLKQLLETKGAKNLFAIGEFAKFCAKYKQTDDEKAEFAVEKTDLALRDDDGEFIDWKCCPHCGKSVYEVPLTVENLIMFARNIEAIPKYRTPV
jgi:plasmid rolling circle replication initiator protein Rep